VNCAIGWRMSEIQCSTAAAFISEPAAQLHGLRQQLHAVQQERDRYRSHLSELESLCWELVGDLAQLRGDVVDGVKVHADFVEGGGPSVREERPIAHKPLSSITTSLVDRPSSLKNTQSQRSSLSSVVQGRLSCPRVRGPLRLELDEAQALLRRLWTLRQWMGDLVDSVATFETTIGGARSSSVGQQHTPLLCRDDAAIREEAAALKTGRSAPQTSSSSQLSGDTPQQLHRTLDDIFLQFTQLQASLTNTLWTTSHPPALSTPAHTRQDSEIEVARLQTINQELRRTLRAYEQSHSRPNTSAAGCRSSRSASRKPSHSTRCPPPGYVEAPEKGLFVAFPRSR
jgi:hypothetical protein